MSNSSCERSQDHSEHGARMRRIGEEDGHFARLFKEYRAMNLAVLRAESNDESSDSFRIIEMRKKRLELKDEIYGMLAASEPDAERQKQ